MPLISIIILTKDEEVNLPECLSSLHSLDSEIFIVDSGSTDATVSIGKSFGCHIYTNEWTNHAEQVNWAINNLPIKTPWCMRLDGDEKITPELVEELNTLLLNTPKNISGYMIKRRVFFMGRWIRHGGYYPTWLLRVWRTGQAYCEQRWMDEHMILSTGEIDNLKYDIIDENHKGLGFWVNKHNRYAQREVQDLLNNTNINSDNLIQQTQFSQVTQRRWVKKNLYGRSPLFLRAFGY